MVFNWFALVHSADEQEQLYSALASNALWTGMGQGFKKKAYQAVWEGGTRLQAQCSI